MISAYVSVGEISRSSNHTDNCNPLGHLYRNTRKVETEPEENWKNIFLNKIKDKITNKNNEIPRAALPDVDDGVTVHD